MACLRYLRDVFIVLGILLIISGIVAGWAVLAACALISTYLATMVMRYRPPRGKNDTPSS